MSERLAFIQACLDRTEHITTICDRFGISEKTGHKWLARFRAEGPAGLEPRSHAPHGPHRITAPIAEQILEARRRHPLYGAAKLRDWLVRHHPTSRWPAASSIGALLVREGLIRPRRRRPAPGHSRLTGELTPAMAPNHVWTADFKGHFRVGAGPYCYPLTVLDLQAHFLLGCAAQPSTAVAGARTQFVRLFREYGLPVVLRTDNGVPFAQPNAIGRLGGLAFWWVRLGIRPEHTTPATPSENGAHERFHRTLAAATARPPAASLLAQQRRFDDFRREYNTDRPHAALPNHVPPAQVYESPTRLYRPYPTRLPTLCYPADADVRRVAINGHFKWRTHCIFLSHNLAGDDVCLTPTETEWVQVAYASLQLGELDPYTGRFRPNVRWLG
jgi:transposase InsO family protein